MSKKSSDWLPDEPGVVGHRWLPKQRGLDIKAPKRGEVALILVMAVIILIACRAALAEPKPETYRAARETPTIWSVTGYVFAGLVFLLVLAAVGALILRVAAAGWKAWKMAEIEIERARLVENPQNGHTVITRDRKVVDARVAPAGVVDRDGKMPVPETADHEQGVKDARMLQALMATSSAGVAVELMREPEPPPKWIEADNEKADWERQLTDGLE